VSALPTYTDPAQAAIGQNAENLTWIVGTSVLIGQRAATTSSDEFSQQGMGELAASPPLEVDPIPVVQLKGEACRIFLKVFRARILSSVIPPGTYAAMDLL